MGDIHFEATRRILLAQELTELLRSTTWGVAVVGSVAHSPAYVKSLSDLDMLVIVDNLTQRFPLPFFSIQPAPPTTRQHPFDGYCLKNTIKEIPVSLHIFSKSTFDTILYSFTSELRLYRTTTKEDCHTLYSFDGKPHTYPINNIPLKELDGVCNIIPIALLRDDTYYMGVSRNKLLSNPIILHEDNHLLSSGIEKLWQTTTEHMYQESLRRLGHLDLNLLNVHKSLAKKETMSLETQRYIWEKTCQYLPNQS